MNKNNKNNKEKGNNFMEVARRVILGLIFIALIVGTVSYYKDTHKSFWEVNELRITQEFDVVTDNEKSKTALDQETKSEADASETVYKKIKELKEGIAEFFSEEYGINVEDKLNKLDKVYIYSSEAYEGNTLYGFVDSADNTVHLHKDSLSDETILSSVFVHETMHYLGITPPEESNSMYLVEGFAEALAQKCLSYLKKDFFPTKYYELQRKLAFQILAVDKEIVVDSINDGECKIADKITHKTKNLKRSIIDIKDVGENLENCISSITYETAGERKDLIVLQSQDIVSSYLKTFNPSKEQINQVRQYYVMKDYEKIKVVIRENVIYLVTD